MAFRHDRAPIPSSMVREARVQFAADFVSRSRRSHALPDRLAGAQSKPDLPYGKRRQVGDGFRKGSTHPTASSVQLIRIRLGCQQVGTEMKSFRRSLALVATILSANIVGTPRSAATESNTPIAYFSEGAPDNLAGAMNNLPPDSKDVVVAKVRLRQTIVWMGGRHCELCTNDIWFTRLKITEALRGKAEVGQVIDVFLGQRSEQRRHIALPRTPIQLSREYTVVIYSMADGIQRLASFPIGKAEYDGLSERERLKPGFHD